MWRVGEEVWGVRLEGESREEPGDVTCTEAAVAFMALERRCMAPGVSPLTTTVL